MPGTGILGEVEDSGLLVGVDNYIGVDHGDRQGLEAGRGHHRAWAGLLHESKAVVHFDRDGYQTDQQQGP